MKRGIAVLFVLLIIIGISLPVYGNTYHRYLNGEVEAISDNSIVVAKQNYTLAPNAIYLDEVRHSGSYYKNVVRRSDVHIGQYVYIKVEGSTVYEVTIVGRKQ